jgi:hypothetical protein
MNQIRLKGVELSIWAVLLPVFVFTYTIFNLSYWKHEGGVVRFDVVHYYSYLPATFIYDDVTLEHPNENFQKFNHIFWHLNTEGPKVCKTTCGMSILYAPFFALSHVYCLLTGDFEPGGYSPPYLFGIGISGVFYLLIGLLFLRKFLRLYFEDKIVAIALICIALGTNVYCFTSLAQGMPHVYLFSLLSVAMYYTELFFRSPSKYNAIVLGFVFGLMVLIRPITIILVLFPVLYNVTSTNDFKLRIDFLQKHWQLILLSILCFVLVWVPQWTYWKLASGDFWYYSYTDERFYWLDSKFIDCLIGFRKGWLLYSPIMVFSLIGIWFAIRSKFNNALLIGFIVCLYFYVATCWWDCWFGGSFGYRTMIDVYPLLSVTFCFFVMKVFLYKKTVFIGFLAVFVSLISLSLFQTKQYQAGIIHHDAMTKEAYFKVFLKLKPSISREEVAPLLEHPDYDAMRKGIR